MDAIKFRKLTVVSMFSKNGDVSASLLFFISQI